MKTVRKPTIIFDLGGVILNLDIPQSLRNFEKITGIPAKSLEGYLHQKSVFLDYEMGLVDDVQFRNAIREMANKPLDDQAIDEAWNSMLLDIPQERLDWIAPLREHYRLVVLSNTNGLHIRRLSEIFRRDTRHSGLNEIFDRMYYSFELRMRKPDSNIFEHVIRALDTTAAETTLIDDNTFNIEAAKALGINTIFVEHNQLTKAQLPYGNA